MTHERGAAPTLFLTGGRQRAPLHLGDVQEWVMFDRALLLELDTESGEIAVRLEYTTPVEHRVGERESVLFKSGSTTPDGLVLVTQTEVLKVRTDAFAIESVLTHPHFNDVHHAAWIGGRLEVVATGLDRLLGFDADGALVAERSALPDRPSELRPIEDGVDYRKILTTKPHASHPNFVFETAHGVWLTRFEQRDALCLDDPARRFAIDVEKPHDGVHHDGAVWFTTVDGHLVAFDAETCERTRVIDLAADLGLAGPLGWCRGLFFDGDTVYVGFSRIRTTRFRRNLSWLKHGFRRAKGYTDHPTRVLAFSLSRLEVTGEWDLEPFGLNALFSILPRDER